VHSQRLISFIIRYNLQQYVLEWAGLFRFLGHNKKRFSISNWASYLRDEIHPDVIHTFFKILDLHAADAAPADNENAAFAI